jgi:uncharacterized protein YkwD
MSDMGLRRVGASFFLQYLALGWLLLGLISCSSLPPETILSLTYPPTSTAQVAPSLASTATRVGPSASATPTPVSEGGSSLDPGTDSGAVELPTVEPEMTASATLAWQAIEHTVEVGDTLLGLALQYDVPMAAIQIENELGEETAVQAGWVLAIPPAAGWEDALPFWTAYLVKEKDTLISIAASHDLDATVLATVNGISDPGLLAVGQTLILPLTAVQAPEPTQPPALPAPDTSVLAQPISEPSPTPAVANPLPGSIAGWPHELVGLINGVRAQHGMPPFAYSDTLGWAAQLHAEDCAQRGSCSHIGSDGSRAAARILRAGYQAAGTAECWVQALSPQEAVDFWMDETPPNDPHRRTLLSSWMTKVGIGVAPTGWGYYIIADFGRPQFP